MGWGVGKMMRWGEVMVDWIMINRDVFFKVCFKERIFCVFEVFVVLVIYDL